MPKSSKYLLFGVLVVFGLSAFAVSPLPFSFKAGDPIKADEVNANFSALSDSLIALDAAKQNTIKGSPCASGQFVVGIGLDGQVICGIDQIGSAGTTGISSLNGKTGSISIEGSNGISVETGEGGKIILSGGAALDTLATLTFPFSQTINNANPAFAITNNGGIALSGSSPNGAGVYAFSGNIGNGVSAYSEKNYGVLAYTNTGLAGVYGEGKINGGAGVRGVNNAGPGSSGLWGESAAGRGVRGSSTTGIGVEGTSGSGYGVKGSVPSGTGVYGENTSTTTAGAGVQGRANYVNSVGVNGLSNSGTGVSGSSNTNVGVSGTVLSSAAGVNSIAVSGVNNGKYGYGVKGVQKGVGSGVYGSAPTGVGVYGDSGNIGVYGKAPTAMYAAGNAKQELGFGGWAKAMVFLNVNPGVDFNIDRCFNSQATGASVNTTPCGFNATSSSVGSIEINFGYDISQRFFLVTPVEPYGQIAASIYPINNTTLRVNTKFTDTAHNERSLYASFYLIVF